ncbi:MAG TPA: hypothetical protein VMD92_17210 [Acidobacteriaceae bacterium]|nr:hypothetical protein [Acidobacteriaceae bacterium]
MAASVPGTAGMAVPAASILWSRCSSKPSRSFFSMVLRGSLAQGPV